MIRLVGCLFTQGAINGERFRVYVEKVLVPILAPGDIVIMDNLGNHKGETIRRLIRGGGAKLFLLPKYSPDLNPIEQVTSPNSSIYCARRRLARLMPSVTRSAGYSMSSFRRNAPT